MFTITRSNRKVLLSMLFLGIMAISHAEAQGIFLPGQTYFGANNYVEYIAGNLPVIITASHGGDMNPSDIPTRTCSQCVTTADAATQELVRAMGTSFQRLLGCSPHIVINRLHRRKLDANREIIEAAQGNLKAERAWSEFHQFIDIAKQSVMRAFGRGLYLDIHGHGHDIQRLELGYLLRDDELRLPDDSLNLSRYIAFSSIRSLVGANKRRERHAELLRGDQALGTLLAQRGFASVPSKQDPFPKLGDDYFDGGYNTARHSSYREGTIDGLQIECNFFGVRDSPEAIRRFADSLALSVEQFLRLHYAFSMPNSCLATTVLENSAKTSSSEGELTIFPQPSADEAILHLPSEWTTGLVIYVIDVLGNVVFHHKLESPLVSQEYILNTNSLQSGVYAVKVQRKFERSSTQYPSNYPNNKVLRKVMIINH